MLRASTIWVFAGILFLLICFFLPSPVPAAPPGAINPYNLITAGAAPGQSSPAAPPLSFYSNGLISISTEHLTGHVDADWGYNWDYAYDIGVNGGQLLIGLDIQLTGYDPGDALRNQWETGIEGIWGNRYQVTDGTYDYPIVVDVHWVNSDADQVVTVFNGYGNYDLSDWYTITDWGNDYHDELAAHEAGHMFGLYDEYWGGATDPATHYTTSNALMADLGPVQETYFNGFLAWMESRSGLDLNLEEVGSTPTGPNLPYKFRFTYSNGDYYTGTAWAEAGYGYNPGDTWQVSDPYGSTGNYQITGLGQGDSQAAGLVYVTSYFDQESGKTFTPLNHGQPLGNNYLGSEGGYIIDENVPQYFFTAAGQGIYEADLVVGNKNTFTFYYDNGDYYTGAVYANPATFRYYQGYKEYITDENGFPGYYEITGVESGKFKPKPGQVFVYSYYDNESSQTFIPVKSARALGASYLGSEAGYILKSNVPYLKFGGGYWEADVAAIYNFSFYFSNGDYYKGTVYALLGDYHQGDRYFLDDETTPETGRQGYYEITGAGYVGYTKNMGQVLVSSYYDQEAGAFYTPISRGRRAVGKNYLGSEYDWIIKRNVSQYYFGGGYEADAR